MRTSFPARRSTRHCNIRSAKATSRCANGWSARWPRLVFLCELENVFIVSGSQQGLDYLGKLFLSPKDTALVTAPTYLGALQAFNAHEPDL